MAFYQLRNFKLLFFLLNIWHDLWENAFMIFISLHNFKLIESCLETADSKEKSPRAVGLKFPFHIMLFELFMVHRRVQCPNILSIEEYDIIPCFNFQLPWDIPDFNILYIINILSIIIYKKRNRSVNLYASTTK